VQEPRARGCKAQTIGSVSTLFKTVVIYVSVQFFLSTTITY